MIHSIKYLFIYHRYWEDKENNIVNPQANDDTRKMLDLKDNLLWQRGVDWFADDLCEDLQRKLPSSDSSSNMCIVIIPSSRPRHWSAGLMALAEQLIEDLNLDDARQALLRHTQISKLANGGNRGHSTHYDSITLNNNFEQIIYNKRILLLDDITTTGNSLQACAQILSENGAGDVYPYALGQTHEY